MKKVFQTGMLTKGIQRVGSTIRPQQGFVLVSQNIAGTKFLLILADSIRDSCAWSADSKAETSLQKQKTAKLMTVRKPN